MDLFVVRSRPAGDIAPSRTNLGECIAAGDFRHAAKQHPLAPVLADLTRAAFADLRSMTLGAHGTFAQCIAHVRGNKGSMIGTLYEFFLTQAVAQYGFRGQNRKHEADLVSQADGLCDIELKTTSTGTDDVFGNRVAPASLHKKGSFLLAVTYDADSLQVRRIRLGWVTPQDWIAQNGTGQQAKLSAAARARMVCL